VVAAGKVWLVGAGPGDPELITVRGLAALRAADVVLYDALAHPALRGACREGAELRDVGKRFGQPSSVQLAINEELVALARAGKCVVRLKGGDPLLFARGAEEALALVEAGVAEPADIDTVIRAGFGRRLPITGPIESADVGGLETLRAFGAFLFPSLDTAAEPPAALDELIHRAREAGRTPGVYDWSRRDREGLLAERMEELFRHLQRDREAGTVSA
jgi:hypothetical protein